VYRTSPVGTPLWVAPGGYPERARVLPIPKCLVTVTMSTPLSLADVKSHLCELVSRELVDAAELTAAVAVRQRPRS